MAEVSRDRTWHRGAGQNPP